MGLIDGALLYPATEEFLLFWREGLMRLLRGHEVIFVLREDSLDDLRFFGFARDDGDLPALAGLEREFADVEPEATFAGFLIESMAMEAGVRHDRTDVTVEADGVGRRVGSEQGGKAEDGDG